MNKINKKYKTFEDTQVWQDSHQAILKIYKISQKFPKTETYGLSSQIRRSASSISANISEGFNRNTTKELINYLYMARGSCGETINHLLLSRDLKLLSKNDYILLRNDFDNILIQLNKWIKSLKR